MKTIIPSDIAFLPLDAEEAEMMAQDEAGLFVPLPEEEQEKWKMILQVAAENTLRKKKGLSLRVEAGDVLKIKQKAEKLGLPYQSLMASVLHQYAQGTLVSRE